MKDELRISIVVPIYNVEVYIRQSVDSVLNQTYRNLEVILVDDGSPDNCGLICDEYAKRDSRIRVIHKLNGGLSSAREAGINSVSGDYIMFLDGDDWLDHCTVKECVDALKEEVETDCILFSYVREYDGHSLETHILNGNRIYKGNAAQDKIYRRLFGLMGEELVEPEKADSIVSCCMKLYRVGVALNGRFFNERIVGSSEDTLFNMYALYGCRCFIYIDTCFYHYRKTDGSITQSYRPNLIKQWEILFDIMNKIIDEKKLGSVYKNALDCRIGMSIIGIGFNELSNKEHNFLQKVRHIWQYLNSACYANACRSMDVRYLPLKWKLFMFFCKQKSGIGTTILLQIMLFLKSKI